MEKQTIEIFCGRCNRELKSVKAKKEGFGPVCKRKHEAALAEAEQVKQETADKSS